MVLGHGWHLAMEPVLRDQHHPNKVRYHKLQLYISMALPLHCWWRAQSSRWTPAELRQHVQCYVQFPANLYNMSLVSLAGRSPQV
jgi:hypothetical protein